MFGFRSAVPLYKVPLSRKHSHLNVDSFVEKVALRYTKVYKGIPPTIKYWENIDTGAIEFTVNLRMLNKPIISVHPFQQKK